MQRCLLLLLLWLACSAAAHSAHAAGAGVAVAVGGALRDDNAAVWGRIVELAGGPRARFAVFATASGEPAASAAAIVANLQRHGALADVVPVAPLLPGIDLDAAVRDPRWLALLQRANGVFFSGGAQARLVDTLQPGGRRTPLLEAIHALFERGGVVAGTSSGAAVLSTPMFRDAPDVLAAMQQPLRDGIEVDRGFGFVPAGVVVDQHFTTRGRIGRLLPLLQSRGVALGIGVEEDSAVVVRAGVVEVIGSHGALFVDMRGSGSEARRGAFNLQGARLHWLQTGDRFDLATRTPLPRPGATLQRQGSLPGAVFYPDMLGDNTLVRAMQQLQRSTDTQVLGLAFRAQPLPGMPRPDLGFEWRLYKTADSIGWATPAGAAGSVAHLLLDVAPVRLARPLYTPWSP